MFKHSLFAYFVLLLATSLSVLGAPPKLFTKRDAVSAADGADIENWSNAVRLANGLAPRKPKSLYSPTRVARSPATGASPLPYPTYTGYIRIHKRDGGALGWIRATTGSNGGRLTGIGNASNRLPIVFTATPGPFNVAIQGASSNPYLSFVGSATTSSSGNTRVGLVRGNATPPNSAPQNVGSSSTTQNAKTQSAVWSYDSATKRLIPQLRTDDGGLAAPSNLLYESDNNSNNGLWSGFNQNGANGFESVYFEFVPGANP